MPGVIKAGSAFLPACHLSAALAFEVPGIFRHLTITMMIMNNNKIKPGTTPAAKVWDTGTLVSALNKIAAFEGGIKASSRAADAARTTTKGFGYPASIIFGIMMVPTAVIAARIEPQKAAKKPIEITIAMPSPPRQWPTKVVAKWTKRDAAPPFNIAIPAKMNSGTAIRTCFVNAPKDTWTSTDQGRFKPPMAATELPRPNTRNIGTDPISSISEREKASMYIIRIPVLADCDPSRHRSVAQGQTSP